MLWRLQSAAGRHLLAAVIASGWLGVCAGGAQADELRRERLAVARAMWEREYARADGKPTEAGYPTEPAIIFLSAYAATREPKYADQAARQLSYAHSLERNALIVAAQGAPAAHRDRQARQIYNFYLAYRNLADGQYLRWADAGAKAMIETIPRQPHEFAGRTYTQFAASFVNVDDPESSRPVYVIDVNQNAEVGLAFGLLYHDPASEFFRDPLAKEIALQETLASMSIQDMETGAMPLTETPDRITQCDTAYGSYAAFSWVWSQLLWQDARLEQHVRAAGRWLGAKMDLATGSDRYYSFRNPSTDIPPWGWSYRLPLYWYCGLDASEFIAGIFERVPGATPGDPFVAPRAYYDLMGIPRTYYIDGCQGAADAPDKD